MTVANRAFAPKNRMTLDQLRNKLTITFHWLEKVRLNQAVPQEWVKLCTTWTYHYAKSALIWSDAATTSINLFKNHLDDFPDNKQLATRSVQRAQLVTADEDGALYLQVYT
jgi:hypothetical protein